MTTTVAPPRATRAAPAAPAAWRGLRVLGGVAILALVVWRVGTGPFLDGLRQVDARSLVVASLIALLTTVCCACRWRLVARGLGFDVPLPTAVAAYYRSQFLNTTLPGGVLGDVHRGLSHGRDVGDVGLGLRAVAWERFAGQAVQVALTVAVLLLLPSPVHSSMRYVASGLAVVVVGAALLGRAVAPGDGSRGARWLRAVVGDLRRALLTNRAWPAVVVASALVVVGHVTTFVVAARTAGSSGSLGRMVPIALLVLLAMSLPVSIGGWGPREGVAAWAFGAAGLGAAQGVATAVVYGVIVLVASLPGAVVLVVAWLRRDVGAADVRRGGGRRD